MNLFEWARNDKTEQQAGSIEKAGMMIQSGDARFA
jgi:hypothetical protein